MRHDDAPSVLSVDKCYSLYLEPLREALPLLLRLDELLLRLEELLLRLDELLLRLEALDERDVELPALLPDEAALLRELLALLLRELEALDDAALLRALDAELLRELLALLRELDALDDALLRELLADALLLREPDALLLLRELDALAEALLRDAAPEDMAERRLCSESALTTRLPSSREGMLTKPALRSRRLCS